jgi:hypothetical protein
LFEQKKNETSVSNLLAGKIKAIKNQENQQNHKNQVIKLWYNFVKN